MKLAVAILISGSGSNMVKLVKSMDDEHPAFPSVVISSRSDALGLKKAQDLGVPTEVIDAHYFKKNNLDFEKELIQVLNLYNIEIICLAGFMKILSKKFIDNFKNRILNIHPSLLPKYKGLNTHQRAINNNEKFTGCTVHYVNSKLDSGKIILQKRVRIFRNDSSRKLAKRVLKQEHLLYPKALKKVLINL